MQSNQTSNIKYDIVRVTEAILPRLIGIWPCFYSLTVYHLPSYAVITSKNLQISTCFLLLGLWSASHQGWSSDILENVFCIEQVCYVSCL